MNILKKLLGKKRESKYMPQPQTNLKVIQNKKEKQMHTILKVLLERSGRQVSVLDLQKRSQALNHTARITNLRTALFNLAGKPTDIDFTCDIIRNQKTLGKDSDGDKCIHSTYILMPEFHDYAVELERTMRKEGNNE